MTIYLPTETLTASDKLSGDTCDAVQMVSLDAQIMIMYWFISTIVIACAVKLSSLTSYLLMCAIVKITIIKLQFQVTFKKHYN